MGESLILCVLFGIMIICSIIIIVSNFFYNKKEKIFNIKHADYISFYEKYKKMQNELCTSRTEISKYKKTVNHCLEEIKYFPEYSEWYRYYEAKLAVTREIIENIQKVCDTKKQEISDFVKANKNIIESIREDEKELYKDWLDRYDLE